MIALCAAALAACAPAIKPGAQQQHSDRTVLSQPKPMLIPQTAAAVANNKLENILAGWQAGANQQAIVNFVQQSANEDSKAYVPVADRVAVFDLDGTLWVERPQKPMMAFIHKELLKQLKRQPSLKAKQPWKSVARGDEGYLQKLNYSTLYLMLLKAHEGQPQQNYDFFVRQFLKQAQHPDYKKSYLQLAYQPMRELIAYLQAYDYQVYIVDSSDSRFVRALSLELFNVPIANVIGSSAMLMWRQSSGELIRGNEFVAPINNDEGKPVNIERHIGRRPIIAVGNDDSDIAMLNYAAGNRYKTLLMLVKHDDAAREYAYSDGAESSHKMAADKHWLSISMKQDFKQLFQ